MVKKVSDVDPIIPLAVSVTALIVSVYTYILFKVYRATDKLLRKIDDLEKALAKAVKNGVAQ